MYLYILVLQYLTLVQSKLIVTEKEWSEITERDVTNNADLLNVTIDETDCKYVKVSYIFIKKSKM